MNNKHKAIGTLLLVATITFGLNFAGVQPASAAQRTITVTASSVFPAGTKISTIWISKDNPAKVWRTERGFESKTISSVMKEVVLQRTYQELDNQNEAEIYLGEAAAFVAAAALPTGEILISAPIVNDRAAINMASVPLVNTKTGSSRYKFVLYFENEYGEKTLINEDLSQMSLYPPETSIEQYSPNTKGGTWPVIPVVNQIAQVAGPLPLSFEMIPAYNPNQQYTWFFAEGFLPAQPSGTYEITLFDADATCERQNANLPPAQAEQICFDADFNDLRSIVFIPDATIEQPAPAPVRIPVPDNPELDPIVYQQRIGAHLRLTQTPISSQLMTTKFGKHLVDITVENTAASVAREINEKVGKVKVTGLTVTLRAPAGQTLKIPEIRTVTGPRTNQDFSAPIDCVRDATNSSICRFTFKIRGKIAPGKSKKIGLVFDTDKMTTSQTINVSIAEPKDLVYTYIQAADRINKRIRKTQFMSLEQLKTAFTLPTLTK